MLIPAWYWWLLCGVMLQRGTEIALSTRNARWMRLCGGREFGAEHFVWVVLVMVLFFLGLPLEAWWRATTLANHWQWFLLLFCAAQLLRYCAIWSLGKYWNVRIWVIPGAPRVTRGIYRYSAHPNYVAVVLELIALSLMIHAVWTAIVTLLGFCGFLAKRIPAENAALRLLANRT